jgi:YggT family protein
MTVSYFTNPLIFLIETLFGLYIMLVILRFVLQWVRADFYNPISQLVVRLTSPALRPVRRIIPSVAGLDTASLVLAWLLKSVELATLSLLLSLGRNPLMAFAWAIPALIGMLISLLLFAILIRALLSWLNPNPYHPAMALLIAITEPLLARVRAYLPDLGGVDLSPMLAMIGLIVLQMLLLPPLLMVTGSPSF